MIILGQKPCQDDSI